MGTLSTRELPAVEQVLTPVEVAELLRCSAATVYRLIRDDSLPAFRVGRAYRISLPLLRSWIEAQSNSERDAWSLALDELSEAMRREVSRKKNANGDLGKLIASAVKRVRAAHG